MISLFFILMWFFAGLWVYTEYRFWQARSELARTRLDLKLTQNILSVSTETLKAQRVELEKIREFHTGKPLSNEELFA